MAKSTEDNQELEQVPSGPTQLDSEEVPQQVAEHFNIELATVVEVIEDGRPLNA
jgi:electron transfer flavoprotein alpha/beta subunit